MTWWSRMLYSAVTSQVATLTVYLPGGHHRAAAEHRRHRRQQCRVQRHRERERPLSYQWQRGGTNLVDGGRISGATSNVLTIAATTTNDAGDYTVSVINPASALDQRGGDAHRAGAGHVHQRHQPLSGGRGCFSASRTPPPAPLPLPLERTSCPPG